MIRRGLFSLVAFAATLLARPQAGTIVNPPALFKLGPSLAVSFGYRSASIRPARTRVHIWSNDAPRSVLIDDPVPRRCQKVCALFMNARTRSRKGAPGERDSRRERSSSQRWVQTDGLAC
jgi:hypothetical protein